MIKHILTTLIVLSVLSLTGCASLSKEQYAEAKRECKVAALQTTPPAKGKDTHLDDRRAQAQLATSNYYRAQLGTQPNLLEDALRDCY